MADDGRQLDMGQLPPGVAWWDLPLPPCPDCGNVIVWWEAGYVPGTRRCQGCGSMWSVQGEGGRVFLRRERFYGR
jgi:hypothetical protein